MTTTDPLSRRDRQILDIIYAKGSATAAEVRDAMADPPSYSAVRALLRILEDKGHARHETQGTRYVYLPSVPRESDVSPPCGDPTLAPEPAAGLCPFGKAVRAGSRQG